MSGVVENEKPTLFGKVFNFVKNVAERVMDPESIPSDDEIDAKSDAEEEDKDSYVVDFRKKYVPGSTVNVNYELADLSETVPIPPVDGGAAEDLNMEFLCIDEPDLGNELEKEITTVDPQESVDTSPSRGFVGRSIGTSFCTRTGPNYKVNKQKAPSAPALMELMSADFVRTPCRVPDVGRYLDIPAEWKDLNTHHPDVPPLFIVHAQIPNKWPTTVFVETVDGPCYSFIMVFRLTQATVDALADLEHAPPAVRLFAQYCTECREDDDNDHPGNAPSSATTSESTDPFTPIPTAATTTVREKVGDPKEWIGRSKVFVHCNNLAELRLPKFLHAYNAKPALIRESGSLVRGDGYLELDVNIKKFGLLANKTLPVLLARLHLMDLRVGLCVESREEDEMPEGMLGAVRVHKLSADAKQVPMWFTRPKPSEG